MAANTNCPFEVMPFAQSDSPPQNTIFNLNYTCQDFWSLKTRLVDYIRQNFPTTFNDFVESDLWIMMLENQGFIADLLSFKIDQNAQEPFIATVTEVENAFRICQNFGFQPQPPISGRSMWQATINNPLATELTIPSPMDINITSGGANTTIELFPADSDNNPIFNQDIVIPAGAVQNFSIVGLEGQTITETFEGTGDVGQTFTLGFSPVLWESVRVQVDGVGWTEVDYFTDSQRRLEFRVEFNSAWQAFVIFGTNRAGMIPSRGSQIVVTYRIGGGTSGNIVTGFVETQRVFSVEGLDFTVPVSFRNYTAGQFGYAGDTIEDIRRKLPAFIKSQNRCVTGLDYKTTADQFATPYSGQVGKSTAVLRNYGCAGNVIDLYVLAREGSDGLVLPGNELKAALQVEMENKKMITDWVCIRDGVIISVEAAIDVSVDKFYRKFEDEIRTRVQKRVSQFFALPNWEYGKTLKDTDLIKALSDIKEATNFDITFTTDDPDNGGAIVTTRYNEIIRPDIVTVSFMYI